MQLKSTDFSNLENKTILDFTDDPELIYKFTGYEISEVEDFYKICDYLVRFKIFVKLADISGNDEFKKAARAAYANAAAKDEELFFKYQKMGIHLG